MKHAGFRRSGELCVTPPCKLGIGSADLERLDIFTHPFAKRHRMRGIGFDADSYIRRGLRMPEPDERGDPIRTTTGDIAPPLHRAPLWGA